MWYEHIYMIIYMHIKNRYSWTYGDLIPSHLLFFHEHVIWIVWLDIYELQFIKFVHISTGEGNIPKFGRIRRKDNIVITVWKVKFIHKKFGHGEKKSVM